VNYAGKFDAAPFSDSPGKQAPGYLQLDAPPAHAPSDAIVVPDAHFLFNADFKRTGLDLVLSGDGREVVLHDYFKGEKRAALASPDGAHLSGDLVNALTGAVQVSQAGADPGVGKVIGHVTKLQGSATAVRNGVSIILHQGDNVEKGDVVQAGSDSTLGITFIDGTVFGLSSNARMVLNEMVYDPNGSNNSSLISLVAGTISFVAGETAKHGDMKVDTPVATMGIRGTAVLVEIDFTVPGQNTTPDAKFQVLVEPNGTTGSYVLFDKVTLQPIAVVNQAGQQIQISNGVVTQTNSGLPPEIQKLITDVFSLKFTDNSTNPKSTTHFTDVGVIQTDALKFANGMPVTLTYLVTNSVNGAPPSLPEVTLDPNHHIPGPPKVAVLDGAGNPAKQFSLLEQIGKTGDAIDVDTVALKVNFTDVNAGDHPTVSVKFGSFAYQNAQHGDVTGSLSALQLQDIAATQVAISVVPDPHNKNYGSATLTYGIPDGAFDFLAAGETLSLTYIVRVDNNFAPNNEYAEVPITITITGTNDGPVITTNAQTIAFAGGTSVSGGPLTSDDATSGTLAFTDVDLTDTHTVSAKLTGAVLEGGGSIPPAPLALFEQAFSAALASDSTGTGNGAVNWKLADLPVYVADFIPAGQTLTLTYTVTVTDSQGATSQQTVTVTVTGTDEPAVVWIATAGEESSGSLWHVGANWETGLAPTADDDVIIITDQLHGVTPVFPVTIDQAAVAKTVTMNDFGGGAAPELHNFSTLTIGGALTVKADARVYNFECATISVGGSAEFLDQSVLGNSGTLRLHGGGDFGSDASITNIGTIELVSGTLNVLSDVVNSTCSGSGLIQVDIGGTLVLDGGSIAGGAIAIEGLFGTQTFNVDSVVTLSEAPTNGVLRLTGSAVLAHGTLDNAGLIEVSGNGNAFHREAVTGNGALEILSGGKLTLDQGTAFDNGCGTITVDHGATLTLNHAGVTGGLMTNERGGTVALTGYAALIGGSLGNSGRIAVSGHGNVFDDERITNAACATITIALSGVLALTGTGIAGGSVFNHGTIDITGDSSIDGSAVDGGTILIGSPDAWHDGGHHLRTSAFNGTEGPASERSPVTLTVQGGASITDAKLTIGHGDALAVAADAILSGVSVDSSGIVQVDKGALLIVEDSTVSGGGLVNDGTIHVETDAATTFHHVDVDNSGGVIIIDEEGEQPVPSTLVLDGRTIISGGTMTVGIAGTLEIAGFGATLSGVHVENSGIFTVDDHAFLDLIGTNVTGDGTFHVSGTVEVTGFSSLGGAVINDGIIEVTSGILEVAGAISGTGTIIVDSGAEVKLDGANAQTIDFKGQGGELVLEASSFGGKIEGLDISDKLDLAGIKFADHPTATYDKKSGVLTVSDSDGDTVRLTLSDLDYSRLNFAVSDDGHGGTLITVKANDAPSILGETNPPVQTVILSKTPTVLAPGVTTNGEGMATETFDQVKAGSPSDNGDGHGNFYSQALHAWFSASGDAGVVHGSSSDSAAPYVGNGQQDSTNYLSVGGHATETITFDSVKNSFGLYWGSVDAYNGISFYNGDKLVASYSGADISPLLASGGQGSFSSNGYVEFLDLSPFDKVVLSSSSDAFELDNVSAGYISDHHVKLASPVAGALTVVDKDVGDTLTASVTGDAVIRYNGSSHLPANLDVDALIDSSAITFDSVVSDGKPDTLHWTYNPANANFDFLAPGDTLTITYTAQVSDGHGSFGAQPLTITIAGNGASTVYGSSHDDAFTNIGGGVTIFGKGGNDTFVFNSNFGSATIADFDVNKDTIEVDHSLFDSVSAIMASAHSANLGQDTVITAAGNDTITLKGVTLAQLQHHQNDFHII
jgi:hypothetical protein